MLYQESHLLSPVTDFDVSAPFCHRMIKWGDEGLRDSPEDLKKHYRRTMSLLEPLREFGVSAAVHTQTGDVENEVNRLLTYDRVPKLDAAWLKEVNEEARLGRRQMRENARK